jgi:lipid-A-disaccharide synthase
MAPRFLQAARRLQQYDPGLHCVVPMVNAQRKAEFDEIARQNPVNNLHVTMASANSPAGRPVAWDALEACDLALVTSGTATLETALFKRPMVISYVISPLMRRIMAWRSGQQRPYLPWVGLPNVLANDFVVPELLQEEASPEALADALRVYLSDETLVARIQSRFEGIHRTLRCDTPARAASAILKVAYGRI